VSAIADVQDGVRRLKGTLALLQRVGTGLVLLGLAALAVLLAGVRLEPHGAGLRAAGLPTAGAGP